MIKKFPVEIPKEMFHFPFESRTAEVEYTAHGGDPMVFNIEIGPRLLSEVKDARKLVQWIQKEAENHWKNSIRENNLHPVMQQALSPFI